MNRYIVFSTCEAELFIDFVLADTKSEAEDFIETTRNYALDFLEAFNPSELTEWVRIITNKSEDEIRQEMKELRDSYYHEGDGE